MLAQIEWSRPGRCTVCVYLAASTAGTHWDTWQMKAISWHWGGWRPPSTSSLMWLCPQTWSDCRSITITYWRWRLKLGDVISCTHFNTLVNKWTTNTFSLCTFHSTNAVNNGTAFTRSTSTPAGLFRYDSNETHHSPTYPPLLWNLGSHKYV